jgi:hypothetical protein
LKKCAVFLWFFHIIFPALVSTLSAEFLLKAFSTEIHDSGKEDEKAQQISVAAGGEGYVWNFG